MSVSHIQGRKQLSRHGVSERTPSPIFLTHEYLLEPTIEDIVFCSPRFWKMHQDPVFSIDNGCNNIVACHINLFIGTVAAMLPARPDLQDLVEAGLRCEFFGNLLLSEIGHGLDILNI